MEVSRLPRVTQAQKGLALGTAMSYAVGYPVAIVGHSPAGWALVLLGGVLLVLLLLVTVRRLTAGPSAAADVVTGQPGEHRVDIGGGPGAGVG